MYTSSTLQLWTMTRLWLDMRGAENRDSDAWLALGQKISDLLLQPDVPFEPDMHGFQWYTEGDAYPMPIPPRVFTDERIWRVAQTYQRTTSALRAARAANSPA